MKVLKPTTDSQSFYFIPRDYNLDVSIDFRDEETNQVVTYSPTVEKVNDYIKVTDVFDLNESRFYDISVYENIGDRIVFRDKVFCTAQEINQNENKAYTINKDVYKEDESFNNDYIVI
jgi:hypothetical protein